MSTISRWWSRALMVLLGLLLALAALWTCGRLTSPTPAQVEAIALMQQDEKAGVTGENGFPQMMALPEAPSAFPPAVDCGNAADNHCIATIEATPEASAAALEPFRPNLEAAARALRAPVFRDQRPVVSMGIDDVPSFQAVMQLDSLRALDFAAGNTAGALADACTDALATVRWATDPDTLLQGMIGIAAFRDQAMLIADMRRRAPADPLPPSCAALAEPPDAGTEGLLCAAMRGNGAISSAPFPRSKPPCRTTRVTRGADGCRRWATTPTGCWGRPRAPSHRPAGTRPCRPPARTARWSWLPPSRVGSITSPSRFPWCWGTSPGPPTRTTASASSISWRGAECSRRRCR